MMRVRGMFSAGWRLGMRTVSVMSMGRRCTHEQQEAAQHGHPFELQHFAHGAFYHDSARCALLPSPPAAKHAVGKRYGHAQNRSTGRSHWMARPCAAFRSVSAGLVLYSERTS